MADEPDIATAEERGAEPPGVMRAAVLFGPREVSRTSMTLWSHHR
jgi:hypothetical protein